jgi:WD40 repeat protein
MWRTDTGQTLGPVLKDVVTQAFSPDSRILVTADKRHNIRLWDAATGKPLGPVYPFPEAIRSVRLTTDGTTLVIRSAANKFWLWKLNPRPLQGDPGQVRHWIHAITGLELDANHVVHGLDAARWRKHKNKAGSMK